MNGKDKIDSSVRQVHIPSQKSRYWVGCLVPAVYVVFIKRSEVKVKVRAELLVKKA